MILYPGDGVGTKTAASWIGSCTGKTVFGLTDYNGDGRPDVIARDNTTGNIVMAAGNGADGWVNNSTATIAINW
jgi:hypothetical protein